MAHIAYAHAEFGGEVQVHIARHTRAAEREHAHMAGEFGEHGVADVHIDDDDRLCAGAALHEFVRVEGVVGVHAHTRDAVEQGECLTQRLDHVVEHAGDRHERQVGAVLLGNDEGHVSTVASS